MGTTFSLEVKAGCCDNNAREIEEYCVCRLDLQMVLHSLLIFPESFLGQCDKWKYIDIILFYWITLIKNRNIVEL